MKAILMIYPVIFFGIATGVVFGFRGQNQKKAPLDQSALAAIFVLVVLCLAWIVIGSVNLLIADPANGFVFPGNLLRLCASVLLIVPGILIYACMPASISCLATYGILSLADR